MEILKTQIDVKIFGVDHNLKPPTALAVAKFKKSLDGEKDEEVIVQKSIDFLVAAGLPNEVAVELEIHQFTKLIELISVKKN
jgi:hypothetical protein